MISLRESVSELDRFYQIRKNTLECYVAAIRSVAHYAVDLDDKSTEAYRGYLESLASEISGDDASILAESRATLRGLLRDYRDKAAAFIAGLRDELSTSAQALEKILSSFAQADGDNDTKLRAALKGLRETAAAPACAGVRAAVMTAADSIEQGVEQMRQQHQLAAAQFQAEIQLLHKRIDQLETAARIDDLSRLFSRAEIEERIGAAAGQAYGLLLIRAIGLRAAEVQFDSAVSAELCGAFGKRLRSCLPATAAIGRWGGEQFIAMLSLPKRELLAAAKGISENLSGAYSCLKNGKTVRPSIQVSVAVLDSEAAEAAERTFARVRDFFSR